VTSCMDDDERARLGVQASITRRDFVNGALAGAGTSAPGGAVGRPVHADTDTFTGYGGVGDYASANGNTWPVIQAAHRLRDGRYNEAAFQAARPGGEFDLVVVGGGIAGLSAAYYFARATGQAKRTLLLENHSIPGGEARQNEFIVDGERLLGPQGSNDFGVPAVGSGTEADAFFTRFDIPREYRWQPWDEGLRHLRFAPDNYSNMDGFQESQIDVGYHFARATDASPRWYRNIWREGLRDAPFSERARGDLLRWRADHAPLDEAQARYLDTLTYKDYLERVRGYDPEVTRFVEPVVGLLSGVSADAASARLGRQLVEPPDRPLAVSFPGGNSTFARALLRGLLPAALPGADFASLMYGALDFAALDRDSEPIRIRLNATALRAQHHGRDPGNARLRVIYEKGGALFAAEARAVVMASGGWVNRRILTDMPEDLRAAYAQFAYAPALIVNVALKQWRFLYDLGVTACRWFDDGEGFGWCCNIRQTMLCEGHAPPLRPDRPAVLSFYMGLPVPGLAAATQGVVSRTRLLATSYEELELRVRKQMVRLFAAHGFDPVRDIAGIILNRWGHARLIEPPGFHYGREGQPSPLERVREGYGRIAIGHSELNGAQHWTSALEYGKKAGERAARWV